MLGLVMSTPRSPSRLSTLNRNLRWGVGNGLYMACFFTVVVVLIRVFADHNSSSASHRLSLPVIIGVYVVGGVLAGAIVGVLRPLTRYAIGAMLVSLPAFLPIATLITMAYEGSPEHWGKAVWETVLLLTCTAGPGFGLVTWLSSQTHKKK